MRYSTAALALTFCSYTVALPVSFNTMRYVD
jgi:hypothetical protein